jgi:hypothetical protein
MKNELKVILWGEGEEFVNDEIDFPAIGKVLYLLCDSFSFR